MMTPRPPTQNQKLVLRKLQEGQECSQGFLLLSPSPLIDGKPVPTITHAILVEKRLIEPVLSLPQHKIVYKLTPQGRLAITEFKAKSGKPSPQNV